MSELVMEMQSSVIKIKRKRKAVGSLAFLEIILDGENVGIIFQTQTISVPVEPGHHCLQMKQAWGGSEKIYFSIDSGEEINFECEDLSIWQFLLFPYYLTFGLNKWFLLKQL